MRESLCRQNKSVIRYVLRFYENSKLHAVPSAISDCVKIFILIDYILVAFIRFLEKGTGNIFDNAHNQPYLFSQNSLSLMNWILPKTWYLLLGHKK